MRVPRARCASSSSNLKGKKKEKQGEHRSRTQMGASCRRARPRPVLNSDVHAACRRCATLSNLPQPPPGRNPDTAHIYVSSRTHGWMRMDGRGQTLPLRSKLTSTNSKPTSLPLSLTDQSLRRQLDRPVTFTPS